MAVNARDRKIARGMSGSGRRAIRIGKATSATTPIAIEIQAARSCHSLAWPRMTPNARPPTASAATSAPSQSNRPVDLGVARLLDVGQRRPQREPEERDVDQERDPPAEGVDEEAAEDRSDDGQGGCRCRPDAERAAAFGAVEGMGDQRERARDEQGAGGTLGEAEDDQPFEASAPGRTGRRSPRSRSGRWRRRAAGRSGRTGRRPG